MNEFFVGRFRLTMTDNLHPNADELQEELRELLRDDPELDPGDLHSTSEFDRPRGILTNSDREYLAGQKDYEHPQSEANRKQKIRQRTVNAFQDFLLLISLMSEEERFKVFNEEIPPNRLTRSLEAMISFLYLGIEKDSSELEKIVETGVYMGENYLKIGKWSGAAYDVDVSISIERHPNLPELVEKLRDGNPDQLSPAEIGVLVRSGKLDSRDLEELEDTSLPHSYLMESLGEPWECHDS